MVFNVIGDAASSLNVQTVLLFVGILLLTLSLTWMRHPRNLPPGPPAWPLIGNTRGLKKGPIHLVLADWARQYGSIMSIWIGSCLVIVLNDIGAVKEALVKQADCFSDRIKTDDPQHKGSIIMSNGNVWRERRRFGLSALRTLGMGKRSVEHKINEEARYLLESFDARRDKPFDPEHDILNAVSNIICMITFGYRFEYSDPKFAQLIKLIKTNLSSSSFLSVSFLHYLFNRSEHVERLKRFEKTAAFIQGIVEEHRHSFDPNDIRDIIDMYILEIRQHEQMEKVIEGEVAFHEKTMWRGIRDFFVAGTDTTTNTLMWLILYMAIYEDVQKKVQKEIDAVVGCDRQPVGEDSNEMPYTNAVLMEMQRHKPVTPNAVPHQTSYQTEIFGYTVPANTIVFVNLWAILRDPKHWNDPEKFDPTRFLSGDGKTVKKPEAFIPFSFGRRICIGETLAKMEMFLFFVNLLQRFTFSLPAGKPPPSLEGIVGITLGPHPYEIVAKRR
ncbi:cytochrome P450 2U1-like [Acanthaster planci]|uniref:Cytochrome P450 2U1-like n=1 Tax=Acanthaster planci TaxID=133434 RepID=A0A8B7XVR7_ACAPL|nr:cytochrome P450 2U1-like [Acanthaster planci]